MVEREFSYRIKSLATVFVLLCKSKKYPQNLKQVLSYLFHKLHRNNRHHTHHRRQTLNMSLFNVLQNRL